jgi:hypothetical protein
LKWIKIAIGNYNNDPTGYTLQPLTETWNGTHWTIEPDNVHPTGFYPQPTAISCPTTTSCTAWGFTSNKNATTSVPFAQGWNGTHWTIQPTPRLASSYATITDVSCRHPCALPSAPPDAPPPRVPSSSTDATNQQRTPRIAPDRPHPRHT